MIDKKVAKFQNPNDDTTDIMRKQANELLDQGHGGFMMVLNPDQIKKTIDSSIQLLVSNMLDCLTNDAAWIEKMQKSIENDVVSRSSALISSVDMASIVAQEVQRNFDAWQQKIQQDYEKRGIDDQATQPELVISDGAVVAKNGLGCRDLLVEQTLSVKNLAVTGTVNTDCESWNELADTVAARAFNAMSVQWQKNLVKQVLDLAKQEGIDFDQITINKAPLVHGGKLNPSITMSSLQQLGRLKDLEVTGNTQLADTLWAANRRVGVNTDSPDMALSVWDEEVSISLGKISKDRAWIGTSRPQALDIGVNRQRALTIEPDGVVAVSRLRLDRWRISFGNSVPNHSGTRGDIVINHDPKPGAPFAWQCLGGFQWQKITVTCE